MIVDDTLVAVHDPLGLRPLMLEQLGEDCVVASETGALDIIAVEALREVQPGGDSRGGVMAVRERGVSAAHLVVDLEDQDGT